MAHRADPGDDLERSAPTPSSSSGWRWLRHLGFSLPLVASLVAALLVAGSFAVMRMIRGDGGSAGAGGTRTVPLDRTDIDVDRPVDPDLGPTGTATDELRRRGHLGEDDTLTPSGQEGRLGRRVVVRTQQEHRDIPVFAAEVVVTTEGERLIRIRGHPAPDIELDSTTPVNDYPATVVLAEALLDHAIARQDEGTLVIMPGDGGYRLAWLGVVVIDQGPEQVVLDAETGAVLLRVSLIMEGFAREASAGGDGR
jgi:hypothetical protein